MNKVLHIVGCGTLGFIVTKKLYSESIYDSLHIWDYKNIEKSLNETPNLYSSKFYVMPTISKVDAAYITCKQMGNSKTDIIAHNKTVTRRNRLSGIVLDCTDLKNKYNIKSTIQISADGNNLIMDSRSTRDRQEDLQYQHPKNLRYFRLAANAIYEYLRRKLYLKNTLVYVDLERLILGGKINSKTFEVYV
jgi:hypothetical protein